MKNSTLNALLLAGAVVPAALLFWPFAMWGDVMPLVLRVIPSLSAQGLLCRVGKHSVVRMIPLLFTGMFALWGTYLYFTSPHWSHATVGGVMADYVSPFLCCVVACGISAQGRKT